MTVQVLNDSSLSRWTLALLGGVLASMRPAILHLVFLVWMVEAVALALPSLLWGVSHGVRSIWQHQAALRAVRRHTSGMQCRMSSAD